LICSCRSASGWINKANGRRHIVGIWKVQKALKAGNVVFIPLYRLAGEEVDERAASLSYVENKFNQIAAGRIKAVEGVA